MMKKTHIGGQAIIEGIMMRGKNVYTVAVRKPNKEIVLDKQPVNSLTSKYKFLKIPLIRGMIAFVESMVVGVKTLTYSAQFFEDEEQEPSKFDKFLEEKLGEKLEGFLIGFSVFLAIILGIGLFMLAPLAITSFFGKYIQSDLLKNIIEGIIRIGIFLTYLILISRMKDIQRVFEYHGAEHKTISCLENDEELTPENVKKYSRLHRRCGTSFLFIVMIISIIVFLIVDVDTVLMRFLSRILLLPVIAGISYEIIKWAGSSDSKLAMMLSYPGLCLQKLTTSEPDAEQIEVAIAAIKGVLEDEENNRANS